MVKKHTEEALSLISKPGILNPMYGKSHSERTRNLMAKKKISIWMVLVYLI